jgi:hypothetical protein
MTTRQSHKRRGASFEIELRDWFRSRKYDAERLARAGSKDEGDLSVRGFLGFTGIVEAKAPGAGNKIDLSGWNKEAQVEADNYAKARDIERASVLPAVIIKARGKSIADAYVVFRLGDLFDE